MTGQRAFHSGGSVFDEGPSALDRSGQFVGETVLRLYRRARLAEFLRDEMDIENLVDKEHLAALNMFPDGLFDLDDFTAARRRFDEFIASLPVRPLPQTVSVADHIVESFDGHDLTVRVYRPDAGYSDLPGLFWIHGGGMVLGSVDLSDDSCAAIADELAVVVASVDYRLAPEFPYPIPMEDCYAGLTWFFDRAGSLGADPTRIAVGGASAGGGLAAGLALLARDRKTVSPCFQLLTYPMLDDRDKTPREPDHLRYSRVEPWCEHLCVGCVPRWYGRSRRRRHLRGTESGHGPVRASSRDHHRRGIRHVPRREHRIRPSTDACWRGRGSTRLPRRVSCFQQLRASVRSGQTLETRRILGTAPGTPRLGLAQLDRGDMTESTANIIYTWTDEAPALATRSLLPIVQVFARAAGVSIETRDISLAGRIIAAFPEQLTPDQRLDDDLAELGALVKEPDANIIKLPNISASVPQLEEAIAELQAKGYDIPGYPDEPDGAVQIDTRARYDRIKGSAVNPVLREGNSDRRAPKAVKEYARRNPHPMGEWTSGSLTHVSHMTTGDFYSNEKSVTVVSDDVLRIEHVAADGTVTVLKDSVAVLAGEVVDGSFMSVKALTTFLSEQIDDAKATDVLFSLHLKATMMKVSDPIIFGHAVRTYFAEVFDRFGDVLEASGRTRPTDSETFFTPFRACLPTSEWRWVRRSRQRFPAALRWPWSTLTTESPTFTCPAMSSWTHRCPP